MRDCVVALVLLLAVTPVFAQTAATPQERAAARADLEAQIRGMETALRQLNSEQQSLYQQFQMVQEMRRNERQELSQSTQGTAQVGPPPNYEDVVREKQAREDRLKDYGREMDRLYARYRELEDQKRRLTDQLAELVARR